MPQPANAPRRAPAPDGQVELARSWATWTSGGVSPASASKWSAPDHRGFDHLALERLEQRPDQARQVGFDP